MLHYWRTVLAGNVCQALYIASPILVSLVTVSPLKTRNI